MKRRLNCALVAHVDAGKTTLSEAMLFFAGMLRRQGRVDHGDSFLDGDKLERERGITVFSKQAQMELENVSVTLLDTPGHADLGAEAERVLSVCDAAILLVSATEGIQAHTETMWKLLRQNRIPTLIFINKADMPGADVNAVLGKMRRVLSDRCVMFDREDTDEEAALSDDEALEEFTLMGSLSADTRRELFDKCLLFPCLSGSALKMQGIDRLVSLLCDITKEKIWPEGFSARVYKITRDRQDTRLTWLKVTGGKLTARQSLRYIGPDGQSYEEKVERIRIYSGEKAIQVEEAEAGGVYAVAGLTRTYAGQGLGGSTKDARPGLEPVFRCRLRAPRTDADALLRAVRLLEEEDPLLRVEWDTLLREVSVQLMGEMQKEVLLYRLKDRFGIEASAEDGGILYRETILNTVEGVGHYEPLRHYAETHLLLQPLERGQGLIFDSQLSEDILERNWQRLILTHLYEKRHLGVLTGSPITDMRISLVNGRAHLKHTEGGDFRQATYRAVRCGLMRAKSQLLEPMYEFLLEVPGEYLGRCMNDLDRMKAVFEIRENTGERVQVTGTAPVRLIRSYVREVNAFTGGRGRLSCSFSGYAPCEDAETVIRARGYDPVRDIANTPDSVFCSHGAGFTVSWDQVQQYMHLPAWSPERKPEQEKIGAPQSAAPSKAEKTPLEEDKELMRIFERTYGPIRSRAFDRPPKEMPEVRKQEILLPQSEYLLVDGYNVIFAWEELKKAAKDSLEDARQLLMDLLCNYQGVWDGKVILVFDAYRVRNNPGKSGPYRNITVVYTAEAETADNYIEKFTSNIRRPYSMRVVTGDGMEQIITMGHGALRTSAREFREEMEKVNIGIRRFIESNYRPGSGKQMAEAMRRALTDEKQ